jgi:L-ascorbate metabolism protein UlaG (beta-lactamase superfamily)
MECRITYIYHNCFALEIEQDLFLFDYPDEKFLGRNFDSLLRSLMTNHSVYIFISHGHRDHFTSAISKFADYSDRVRYIISSDIPESDPDQKLPDDALIAEPDQEYNLDHLKIGTFRSNDVGVAFLINRQPNKIYFGGDLANWNWDELDDASRQAMETYFDEVLTQLKAEKIDIAFSNADKRLPNWAGGLEFIEKVKPRAFIPMHAFGMIKNLSDFNRQAIISTKKHNGLIFCYSQPGDVFSVSI